MGKTFEVAGFAGLAANIQRLELAASQAFKKGALVLLNSSGLLAEAGADPTEVTGVALQDANTGPGFAAADNPTVVTGRSNEVSVALADRTNVFSARAVNGGTDPVTPLQTHIGEEYGVVKVGDDWVIDMADTSAKVVHIVDVDLTMGTKNFFVKFLEAVVTQP